MIHVTITGADDAVDPNDLIEISSRCSIVEWGILQGSFRRFGTPRFPSLTWVKRFNEECRVGPVARAVHLCGGMSRLFQAGAWDDEDRSYGRWQINGWQSESRDSIVAMPRSFELILQCTAHEHMPRLISDALTLRRASILIDTSGGRGLEPDWAAVASIRNAHAALAHTPRIGFAGGIGPHNVSRVLRTLGRGDYWIAMESGARTGDRFDLVKVKEVLAKVQQFNAEAVS